MNTVARQVSPDSRRTQRGPQPRRTGATETTCAVAPDCSASHAIEPVHHDVASDSDNSNAAEAIPMHTTKSVNRRPLSVNRYDDPISRRLKPLIKDASCREPAKVLALKIGVSPSVVRDAKEERHFVSAQALLKYGQHDPAIAREVLAIMSGCGEANDPANIDRMIRFFMQRSGGT